MEKQTKKNCTNPD